MILERSRPYSPKEIKAIYKSEEIYTLPKRDRQQLYEASIVASVLRTLEILDNAENRDSWAIFLTENHERIPDVRVGRADARPKELHDIEVVSLTEYSERLGFKKFLHETKLAPEYAYPEDTILLCFAEISVSNPQNAAQRMSSAISDSKARHRVVMAFNNGKEEFYAAQIYPEFLDISEAS